MAHTATVAPADVQVDGKVVFSNIANGEFATADVPAGEHVVALFPTGETTDPILGPLTVDLAPRTVTMVYAVGDPADDSMDLVAHSARLAADGTPRARDDRHRFRGARRRRTGDAVRTLGLLRSGRRTMGRQTGTAPCVATRRPGARRGRRGRGRGWRGRLSRLGADPAPRRRRPRRDRPVQRHVPADQPDAVGVDTDGIGVPGSARPRPGARGWWRRRRPRYACPSGTDVDVDGGLDDRRRPARRPGRHPHRRLVARRLAARRPLRLDADRRPHRLAHAGPRAVRRAAAGASGARGSSCVRSTWSSASR